MDNGEANVRVAQWADVAKAFGHFGDPTCSIWLFFNQIGQAGNSVKNLNSSFTQGVRF
jgi:hypothetical protein